MRLAEESKMEVDSEAAGGMGVSGCLQLTLRGAPVVPKHKAAFLLSCILQDNNVSNLGHHLLAIGQQQHGGRHAMPVPYRCSTGAQFTNTYSRNSTTSPPQTKTVCTGYCCISHRFNQDSEPSGSLHL